MKKLLTLFLSLALVVGVLAACGNKEDKDDAKGDNNAEELNMPEPDLEGIPDVVAEVNDEEISKEDFEGVYQQQFQSFVMQAQMSGQEMGDIDQDEIKQDVVENMVGQQLLIQEANAKVSDVSEDEKNKVLDDVAEQSGMEDHDALFDAFKEQGMDKDEVMTQVETQVKVDKLLDKLLEGYEPSEDELKDAYEEVKEQQKAQQEAQKEAEKEAGENNNNEADDEENELPSYDELKDQLKDQMIADKKNEKTNELVEKLRKDADVKIHI